MEYKKNNIIAGALITGAIFTGSAFSVSGTNAFSFKTLGSGNEIRTNLLQSDSKPGLTYEHNCGEKEADTSKTAKKVVEGKCGEKKEEKKKEGKTTEAKNESKSNEAKCGEGKCGEGKCGN